MSIVMKYATLLTPRTTYSELDFEIKQKIQACFWSTFVDTRPDFGPLFLIICFCQQYFLQKPILKKLLWTSVLNLLEIRYFAFQNSKTMLPYLTFTWDFTRFIVTLCWETFSKLCSINTATFYSIIVAL